MDRAPGRAVNEDVGRAADEVLRLLMNVDPSSRIFFPVLISARHRPQIRRAFLRAILGSDRASTIVAR